MKGRILGTLVVILILGSQLTLGAAAQEQTTVLDRKQPLLDSDAIPSVDGTDAADLSPIKSKIETFGITKIDDSTVNYAWPDIVETGVNLQLCFNVTVDSPDQEYMDRFDVDLPDNWTIVEVHPVPDTGCGFGTEAGQEAGNVAYWQVINVIPSGCGGWQSGTYDFCTTIFVPDCTGEPWSLPWNIFGDGYAAPPHEISGVTNPIDCWTASLELTPDQLLTSGCHSVEQTHLLNLLNNTGMDGTFDLTYEVTSSNATIGGPDAIYLGAGVDQDLLFTLTPERCLHSGTQITATVTAQGNGYSDVTTVSKTIVQSGGCPVCIYLPCILRGN